MIAFLSFIYIEQKRKYLLRFLNKPVRYLQRYLFEQEEVDFTSVLKRMDIKNFQKQNIYTLMKQIDAVKTMSLYAAGKYFFHVMGYEKYCEEHKDYKNNKAVSAMKTIKICYEQDKLNNNFL